jgi:hypothetical protein
LARIAQQWHQRQGVWLHLAVIQILSRISQRPEG